jgi:hypothetical protein
MMSMRKRIRGLTPEQIRSLSKEELEVPATRSDFEMAISKIQSSVDKADLVRYEEWMKQFGRLDNQAVRSQFPICNWLDSISHAAGYNIVGY